MIRVGKCNKSHYANTCLRKIYRYLAFSYIGGYLHICFNVISMQYVKESYKYAVEVAKRTIAAMYVLRHRTMVNKNG